MLDTGMLKGVTSVAALVLLCLPAAAQNSGPPGSAGTPAPAPQEWSFYASALGYLIPENDSQDSESEDYISPVLSADRGSLRLQARYNYENLKTGSLWIGRNFTIGSKWTLDVTPMIGGVFGTSDGVALGYTASLSYRRFTAYTEGEYLIGTNGTEDYFYTWSEFTYSPAEWFRAGIVIQRTKAYQTELDIQRGLLAGVSYRNLDFTTYVLNPGWTDPTTVFGIGFRF